MVDKIQSSLAAREATAASETARDSSSARPTLTDKPPVFSDIQKDAALARHVGAPHLSITDAAREAGMTFLQLYRWKESKKVRKTTQPVQSRQRYSSKEKKQALALAREVGVVKAAEKLGIKPPTLYEWTRESRNLLADENKTKSSAEVNSPPARAGNLAHFRGYLEVDHVLVAPGKGSLFEAYASVDRPRKKVTKPLMESAYQAFDILPGPRVVEPVQAKIEELGVAQITPEERAEMAERLAIFKGMDSKNSSPNFSTSRQDAVVKKNNDGNGHGVKARRRRPPVRPPESPARAAHSASRLGQVPLDPYYLKQMRAKGFTPSGD